jgi:predicted AlkP superfamily phosphohydrolase/phosphomutase
MTFGIVADQLQEHLATMRGDRAQILELRADVHDLSNYILAGDACETLKRAEKRLEEMEVGIKKTHDVLEQLLEDHLRLEKENDSELSKQLWQAKNLYRQ